MAIDADWLVAQNRNRFDVFRKYVPVVIVRQLVGVSVLFLVLGLKGHRCGTRLSFVSTKSDPLLFQPLFVFQMVFHVGQNHVTCGNVHAVVGRFVGPKRKSKYENVKKKCRVIHCILGKKSPLEPCGTPLLKSLMVNWLPNQP